MYHNGDESWGVIGQPLKLHFTFWSAERDPEWPEFSNGQVVGFIGKYSFPDRISKYTYIVECEGNHYPATHTTIAGALTDAAVKRRIKKNAPPRAL